MQTENRVKQEEIDAILDASEITAEDKFDCMTVVYCKLPNGFILTESSACIDPANYDVEVGVNICMKRIESKLWQLEGYRKMCENYENAQH